MFSSMGVGREGRWVPAPMEFEISSKKTLFCLFWVGKKQISPFWVPPWKSFGKSPSGPSLEKIFPTPMSSSLLYLQTDMVPSWYEISKTIGGCWKNLEVLRSSIILCHTPAQEYKNWDICPIFFQNLLRFSEKEERHKGLNKTSSSVAANFWGIFLLESPFKLLRWFELAYIHNALQFIS